MKTRTTRLNLLDYFRSFSDFTENDLKQNARVECHESIVKVLQRTNTEIHCRNSTRFILRQSNIERVKI